MNCHPLAAHTTGHHPGVWVAFGVRLLWYSRLIYRQALPYPLNTPKYMDYPGILSDTEIKREANENGLISPFVDRKVSTNGAGGRVISYGLSSYGYDLRVAPEFMVCRPGTSGVIDPKHFEPEHFQEIETDKLIMPPHSFALARSVETIRMPRYLTATCLGKSTYARCGLILNVTPLEAGWTGEVTLEISNTTPRPAAVYAHEGIVQVLFHRGQPCETSYGDMGGKYQDQKGITLPR